MADREFTSGKADGTYPLGLEPCGTSRPIWNPVWMLAALLDGPLQPASLCFFVVVFFT